METKQTERISLKQYCPTKRFPLDKEEIFLRAVRKEDEVIHAGEPPAEIPKKFKLEKVKKDIAGWINFTKVLLKENARQLIP